MKKQTTEIVILILVVIPFIAAALVWQKMPTQMPIHFNINGTPDKYGSKIVGLLVLPVIGVVEYLILKFLPPFMSSAAQFGALQQRLDVIRLALQGFLAALYLVILLYTLNRQIDILLFLVYALVLLMLVIGNNMNNIKPNYFMGVRTPWTMKDPEVWRKTHHFTARLWVAASLIIMCVVPFLPQRLLTVILPVYFTMLVFPPVLYSWITYKKNQTI